MKYPLRLKKSDKKWDRQLHINTMGLYDKQEDDDHFRYEPTPYEVLARLKRSGYISSHSRVLDYGCGKGRVCFFLSDQVRCQTKGVDFSQEMIEAAEANKLHFDKKEYVRFACEYAEKTEITDEDAFFFFNPFSYDILKPVLARIIASWYAHPRDVKLFFYYPSPAYLVTLFTTGEMRFVDEIDCQDLFAQSDDRERVVIFEIGVE
ncbi:MAG: class I SAM-dependent methyltransferase [Erysipelotrichaceae bacterium]|nr:class I SAM-dependent methyltransferase [Erysipelotrichaceae bacterium]